MYYTPKRTDGRSLISPPWGGTVSRVMLCTAVAAGKLSCLNSWITEFSAVEWTPIKTGARSILVLLWIRRFGLWGNLWTPIRTRGILISVHFVETNRNRRTPIETDVRLIFCNARKHLLRNLTNSYWNRGQIDARDALESWISRLRKSMISY